MAQEKFLAVLYPGHPYGRLFPTPEMLQGYTLAQVRAFHEANYGAARAHIYVVGRFDEKAMEAAIRAAFGDWKKGAAPTVNPPKPSSERAVYLIDRPGAVQSTVILGMPVIDPSNPDWIPLQVTNTLLGGFFSSRITANIREAEGLHVLAQLRGHPAQPRRVLGRDRGRHDGGHRARRSRKSSTRWTGSRARLRPRRSSRESRTTWRARSFCRTPRGPASSGSSPSWTCRDCRTTT